MNPGPASGGRVPLEHGTPRERIAPRGIYAARAASLLPPGPKGL